MATEETLLLDLADAILDGRPIDWTATAAAMPAGRRKLLEHFQSMAGISSFHLESSITAASANARSASRVDDFAVATGSQDTRSALGNWGPLSITSHLGRGRFGDVYRAWDRRLDRPVALKLLRRAAADDQTDTGSAVIDEGRLMARVRHPNVVTVYGAERIDGRVGLWMELVEGRTLEGELLQRGPLPWREVAAIGIDLASALNAVHRAGLLHRDLKAQNVLREHDGRVVLADFGAGYLFTSAADEPADLAGTPLYLAPEVLAGAPATTAGDIYSLGVLLFHLVTRSYPVRGRSLPDLREAHRQSRRSRLRDARADLPSDFLAVVERALAIDPAERFPSADSLGDALARILATPHEKPVVATEVGPSTDTARTAPRLSRPWVAAAVVLIVASVAAVMVLARSRTPETVTIAAGNDSPTAGRRVRLPSFTMGLPSRDGRFFPYFDEAGLLQIWEVATAGSRAISGSAASWPRRESGSARSCRRPSRIHLVARWWRIRAPTDEQRRDVAARAHYPADVVTSPFQSTGRATDTNSSAGCDRRTGRLTSFSCQALAALQDSFRR